MKKLYVLLSKTQTRPSRFIHHFTGGAFTHVSLALTPETDRFYSFARRSLRNPFKAGMIVENTNTMIFALFPDCPCALYEIEVSDEGYAKAEQIVKMRLSNYKKSKYNFFGALLLRWGIRIKRKWKLVCSQFVALILEESGAAILPKDPYLMLPNDFLNIKEMKKIYDGPLKNCNFSTTSALSEVTHA